VPLLVGFMFNSTSTFTTFYSRRLGDKTARVVCVLLRDVLGIPVWALGYIMAARADSPLLFNPGVVGVVAGCLLVLCGGVVIYSGLHALRGRAAAPSVHDSLVDQGIYRHIRHPLYSGMLLELAGIFLIVPSLSMLVACSLGEIWV
jgi:protein-S-isoprenylcysteine O-methyltransferase Ste14